jgi:hypothetical protein
VGSSREEVRDREVEVTNETEVEEVVWDQAEVEER